MPTKLFLLATVVLLVVLAIYCTGMHSLPIESAIRTGASNTIASGPISGVQVAADGRDLTLTGIVPSEAIKKQAGDLALASAGVRTVDNKLVVTKPPVVSPPDAKTVQTSINRILLDKKIEFQTNRDILLPQSIPVLDDVLKVLNQVPLMAVRIEGHTDSIGDPRMNRSLSKARAEAVVEWFAHHGIAKTRMTAFGFGAEKPIATNATSAGRFANRRVEILTN